MTRIRVGDKYVEFVTEDVLILTEDPEKAGMYSWEGQVRAAELIRYHLTMDRFPARDVEHYCVGGSGACDCGGVNNG